MSKFDRRTAISVTMEQDCQIESYFHCVRCGRENLFPNIAVGLIAAGTHLQVWCETHNISLGMFELKETRIPPPCAMCGKNEPHVH
jgi:hypothetical protein